MNFSLKILVLKIIWSHEHTCHITKTVSKWFCRNFFPEFFKISVPLEFDRLKCEEEKKVFDLKSRVHSILSRLLSTSRTFLHVHFNPCPIPLDQSDFNFQKHIGIRSDFSKNFLSISLNPLLIPSLKKKKKKLSFSWSKFQMYSS